MRGAARKADASALAVAVVGSGPAGCYAAQAIRKAIPESDVTVFDRLPIPFGLVRYGVAADHQGTKAVTRQFARLFEKDGVRFAGGVHVGEDVTLAQLRDAFDVVVVATGLHADAPLAVPGADLPGVHGAGRITRLLNGHPGESRPAPRLGAVVGIVGNGNVAMDIVRLLAADDDRLDGSDIDDDVHAALTGELRTLHVFGRSVPASAKFDPVMLGEIASLPGVAHVVHFAGEHDPADARSAAVRALPAEAAGAGSRLRVEWWFGASPLEVLGSSSVEGISVSALDGKEFVVAVDDIITAVGFGADDAQQLVDVHDEARGTGRVDRGLYVTGWARRGPRGTIPTHRTDARELAERIAREAFPSGRAAHLELLGHLETTQYADWSRLDLHEMESAPSGRIRRKVSSLRDIRAILSGAPIDLAPEPPDSASPTLTRTSEIS
ncbi:MAG TPA: FAD-dependent oxidoreductase [Microbacterium sp.]|nr:FAD-dependent oxidoreductase [Microbacterium sp.]